MKKTAVKWLEEQLKKGVHNNDVSFYDLIDQAKEMEKQQIIDAANGDNYLTRDFINRAFDNGHSLGEQYYNETYKK